MAKFRTNFKIESIDLVDYTMKSDNSSHKMKTLNLTRLRQDKLTGKWLPAFKNAQAKAQVFPLNIINTADGFDFIKNPNYTNAELYKAEGAMVPLAIQRWDTSDFNFPKDGLNPLPRKSINVSVFVDDESESDEDITNNLIGQALYQTRGLGVTIYDEYGSVAVYKNRDGDMIPAISTDEQGQKDAVAKADKRSKDLRSKVAALKDTTTETKTEKPVVEFDEAAVLEAFVTANPTATEDEIDAHMIAELDAFEKAQGATNPA